MVVLMDRDKAPGINVPGGVGRRVKERRTALGLSQDGLARASRLSKNYIYGLEHGDVQEPRADTLRALAKGLEVSDAWLLTGNEDETGQFPMWARELGGLENPENEKFVRDMVKRLQRMEKFERLGIDPDEESLNPEA